MKGEFISIETLRINQEIEKDNTDLQNKVDQAIEYILKLKQNAPDEKALDKLLKILKGETYEKEENIHII